MGIADDAVMMGNAPLPQIPQATQEASLKLQTYLVNLNVRVTDRAGAAIRTRRGYYAQ